MTIAYVGTTSTYSSSSINIPSAGSGNLLVAFLVANNVGTLSCSDNRGGTWVGLTPNTADSNFTNTRILYALNHPGGNTTITPNFGGTADVGWVVMEFSGNNLTFDELAVSNPANTTSHVSGSVTPTESSAVLIGCFGILGAVGALSWDVNFTEVSEENSHCHGSAYRIVNAISSYSATVTSGSASSYASALSLSCFYEIQAATLNQHSFRFFNDDGSESASTAKANLNTNINVAANDILRARFLIDATGDPTGKQFQLEYRRKPSGGSFGSWTKVN